MYQKTTFYFLLFVLSAFSASAQSWDWVQTAGSKDAINVGNAVATDNNGNVCITGFHHAPLHLHRDLNSAKSFTLVNAIRKDDRMFVAKYDNQGTLQWANFAQGESVSGMDIKTDDVGNIYVTGIFSKKTKFSSRDGNNKRLVAHGGGKMFLAKYDKSGNLKWVVKGGSKTGRNTGRTICLRAGRIFVLGQSELLGPEPVEFRSADYALHVYRPASPLEGDIADLGFLAEIDNKGRVHDMRFFGGKSAHINMRDMKIDAQGNFFVSGTYTGKFTEGTQEFEAMDKPQGFVMALDTRKKWRWDLRIDADFSMQSEPLIAIWDERLALGFASRGSIQLHGTNLSAKDYVQTQNNAQHIALIELNQLGQPIWDRILTPKAGVAGLHDIAFDHLGFLYQTGHYGGQLELKRHTVSDEENEILSAAVASKREDINVFLLRYNQRGEADWLISSAQGKAEIAYGLAIDKNQYVYTTGYFEGKKGAQFGKAPLREVGKINVFLAKVHPMLDENQIVHAKPFNIKPKEAKVVATLPPAKYDDVSHGRRLLKRQSVSVTSRKIDLYIWDNHQNDIDVISLFLNDSCLLRQYRLRPQSKHIQIEIPLNKNSELLIYAESIGKIAPNTTAITLDDGYVRQRVHLLSDMHRSEVLEIRMSGARSPKSEGRGRR